MLPIVIHYQGRRYVPAAAAVQVKVVRWKRTNYDEAFWQELIRRIALKLIGPTPVKIKLDFKYFKSTKEYGPEDVGSRALGTSRPFTVDGWWEITIDPKNQWHLPRALAHSLGHEMAHVAQRLRGLKPTPGGVAWDKDPQEIEAERLADVGTTIFDQLVREGWKTQSSQLPPVSTIIKAPPGVSPDDWKLLDKPLADMTPDELRRIMEVQRMRKLHHTATS